MSITGFSAAEPSPGCLANSVAGSLGPALVIAISGILYLLTLRLAPRSDDLAAILYYPPWVQNATITSELKALALPLRDIGWSGRLLVLGLDHLSAEERRQFSAWRLGSALRLSGAPPPGCAQSKEFGR
jgi:hypothetical protein